MLVAKRLLAQMPTREYRKELKYLRARRQALDSLIASLELYLKYTPKGSPESQGSLVWRSSK